VVTGQSTSEVVGEALKLGAAGFVVKPFNAEKLLRAIHNALAARAA
jgi:DNA-binding NtrC family response regulator